MLASIREEKASSCKLDCTSEHLFRSHLQMHVTRRLGGKCLTSAGLASSCFLEPVWEFCCKCQRQKAPSFSSTTHTWRRCKPSLCWERGFQTLFLTAEWFHTPNSAADFCVSAATSAHFCVRQRVGNAGPRAGRCLSGLRSSQGVGLALAVCLCAQDGSAAI